MKNIFSITDYVRDTKIMVRVDRKVVMSSNGTPVITRDVLPDDLRYSKDGVIFSALLKRGIVVRATECQLAEILKLSMPTRSYVSPEDPDSIVDVYEDGGAVVRVGGEFEDGEASDLSQDGGSIYLSSNGAITVPCRERERDPIEIIQWLLEKPASKPYDQAPEEGIKHDSNKPRWDLLPWRSIAQIVDVVTFGAGKYAPNNWQKLADPQSRYFAALMRHLVKWKDGEKIDPETGISHLAHAGCNVVFLMWFEDQLNE